MIVHKNYFEARPSAIVNFSKFFSYVIHELVDFI